jgi:hypothetical protein
MISLSFYCLIIDPYPSGPGTYLIRFDDSIEDEEGGWLCLSYINKNNHFKEKLFQRKLMSTGMSRSSCSYFFTIHPLIVRQRVF